jgi:hypothetical protein
MLVQVVCVVQFRATPMWRDTYHTPVVFGAAGPETSNFTAHVCFTARWNAYTMVHCHIPSHMDIGIAVVFTMVPSEAEANQDDTSTAAPGAGDNKGSHVFAGALVVMFATAASALVELNRGL